MSHNTYIDPQMNNANDVEERLGAIRTDISREIETLEARVITLTIVGSGSQQTPAGDGLLSGYRRLLTVLDSMVKMSACLDEQLERVRGIESRIEVIERLVQEQDKQGPFIIDYCVTVAENQALRYDGPDGVMRACRAACFQIAADIRKWAQDLDDYADSQED